MLSILRCLLLMMLGGMVAAPAALAQTAQELAHVEKELASQKEAAKGVEAKEKATSSELEGLRKKLITATAELQAKQEAQDETETRLTALEKEMTHRAGILQTAQARLASLTSALVQLSREPPELFVLHEDSPDDHIHRGILLHSLLPRLREQTTTIAKELENYQQLSGEAMAQKKLLIATRQNLEWQKSNLDKMVAVRQGLLQKTTAEKEVMQKQLDALAGEAADLRQLMDRVSNPAWAKSVGIKGEGAADPVLKAGLRKPVSGKIIKDYGDNDDFGVTSEGVTILAAFGSPVVAPRGGLVVFAGPFRGYGKVVILQHTGGYHAFLSGFSRLDVEIGQKVESGEPLGVLPQKGDGKPEIYFEWRKGTTPIDPTVGK
ncbi:MAG: peptidoglycan DD-metalloendopeptidase family protein [Alphaproteobacteria bacterium]|nr:peptidoglycan DD-metalloendopeptidase family protein [Alphaproteobacteria bacterium]